MPEAKVIASIDEPESEQTGEPGELSITESVLSSTVQLRSISFDLFSHLSTVPLPFCSSTLL